MRKFLIAGIILGVFSIFQTALLAQQLTFNVSSANVSCDDQNLVPIEISVENFDTVANFQFAVLWDPAVLTYENDSHVFQPLYGSIASGAANGELRIGWADFAAPFEGESFTDSTKIITLYFRRVGAGGTTTDVEIGSVSDVMLQAAYPGGKILSDSEITTTKGSVNIFDNEKPTIQNCPSDIAVSISPSETTGSATWAAPSANDNCNVVSFTSNFASGDNFSVGNTIVTYTAKDDANNEETCSFEVTVTQDANAGSPRFELPEIVLDCEADSAIVHLKVFNFDTLSSIQFGIHWDTSIFKYRRHLNFFPAAATYFYTHPDSSAIGLRWVDLDFQLPIGEDLPDDMTVLTLILDKVGMAGDSSSLKIDTLPNFPIEIIKKGFALDPSDFVLKNGFVKLADTLSPVIANCPIDRTVLVPIGATKISVDWLAPTATDNCNLTTYTSNFEPKDTFSLGTTEVIYIAIDDVGNADTCAFEITVVEDAAAGLPTFEFDKITTGCNPDSIQIDLKVYHFDTLSSFQFGMKFDTSVLKYRRHLNFLPPMATFFHADANSPKVGIRWADLTFPLGENLPDTTTILRFVFDVVGEVGDSSFIKFDTLANFPIEVTKQGLTLNSTGYVLNDGFAKIGDTEKPVFSDCPTNMTIPAGTTCEAMATWKTPTVEDNCAGTLIPTNLSTFNSGDTFPLGTAEVVYAADDGNGNSDTCRFTIIVADQTDPTLRCRTDTIITTLTTPISVGDLSLVGAMDNCVLDTIYFQLSDANTTSGNADASNSSFEEGTTTVTYFGEDEAGNVGQCSFDVTIIKNNPVNIQIECPDPLPVSNETGSCDAEVNDLELQVTSGAADLVDTSFVINTSTPINGSGNASGNSFPVGTTMVTYTVQDTNGDDHSCTFSVTVNDTEMPMITCPSDVSISIHPDSCDVAATWTAAMATDNCPGGISLSSDSISGVRLLAGTHPVTYMARDLAANEVTCTFNVIVTGNGSITFSNMPLDTILKADTTMCSADYSWATPTASSVCGSIDSLVPSHVPGTFPVGATEVTYVAYNSSGSTDTARFTITVQDTEMPVVIGCPNDTTIFANPATCTAAANWTPTTATDNCGIFDFFKTHQPDYEFPASTRPADVLHIASDSSGNSTICNFKVTVVDTVKPYFPNCPAGVAVFVDGTVANDPDGFILFSDNDNCVGARLFFGPVAATDTCGTSIVTQIENPVIMSGQTFGVGGHEIIYQASDDAGNIAECRVNITVNPLPDLNAQIVGGTACEGDDIQIAAALTGMNLTYNWTGPDNFMSSIIDPIITDVDATKSGDYTIVATSPNGCTTTDVVTVSASQKPELEITHNDVLCAAGVNDLDLAAADLANTNIKSWAWTGPQTFSAATQNATVSNVTPDNSGVYKIVACTVEGCIDSTELDIQISSTPIIPTLVPVGDDDDLCAGETATLLGEVLNGQNVEYFWDVSPDNGVDWTPANINVLPMTFNETGDFTVRYWGSVDGCLSDTAEVVISVNEAPSVALGSNAPLLCTDGTESLELFVNGSADSYEWSGPNGFMETAKNPIRTNVTAADAGIYTLKATNGDGCTTEESVQIEITEGPSPRQPVVEPAIAEICLGESLQYFGQPYSSTSPVIISWFASPAQGAGLPPGLNSRAIEVIPTEAGVYNYKYVVEVGGCSTDTTTVTLTVNDLPNVTLSYNAPLTCITEGMSLELSESGGTATSWNWSGPQTFTSNDQNPVIPNITKDVAGTYTVEVENAGGCKNTASIDVVISDGLQPLDITVSNANPCEDLDMLILETDMIPGAVYNWTGPVTISTTTNQVVVPSATADYSGMYTVTATTADGCVSPDSDSMSVEVLDAPICEGEYVLVLFENPIDINVLGNDVFNMTRPFNISVISPPSRGTIDNHKDGTFTYTPDDKELDEDYMTYEICYEECDMLCSRAVVTFDIKHDPNQCVIPTVITPNNDGKNDMLRISCVDAGTFPNNEILIMNEWGDQVFKAGPYNNDWDGTYNGSPVPDGTYYYLFFRTPGAEPQKGFITVFR